MPNIKFTGLEMKKVQMLSELLTEELSKEIGCPSDWITFSMTSADGGVMFCEGKEVNDTVFINVEWFDRGDEVKKAVVKIINGAVLGTEGKNGVIVETVDIIFVNLEKANFYENGESF